MNHKLIFFITILLCSYHFCSAVTVSDLNDQLNVPLDLKCKQELSSLVLDGSCLLQGISALKKKEDLIFATIESYCLEVFLPDLIKDYRIFSSFLKYYPKCKYVVEREISEEYQVEN
jgi:hypothetical protein